MTAKKNDRVQCMIERYKKEVPSENDRYFNIYKQSIDNDIMRYYCFPVLFSALFYNPTPEQLSYIADQAVRMTYRDNYFVLRDAKRNKLLPVINMMQLAAYAVGNPDFQYWRETFSRYQHDSSYPALLICGSAHPNGYFREQCLLHFLETDMYRMIGFMYARLNDWVPEVRRTALKVLTERMKKPDAANTFIDAMPYAELVRRGNRAHRESAFSMDALDQVLMYYFEAEPGYVLKHNPGLCYKVFALHPDPKYRGLILHFYQRECSGELRCLLERIYIRMTEGPIPANVLDMFMQDKYVHARLIAYEYRFGQEGLWEGFEQLLQDPSRRVRDFASKKLKEHEFDYLAYARKNLPGSLPLLGNFGTEADIPLVRQYLETNPAEAMYALAKLGAADSKAVIIKNMQSADRKLSKAANRLARALKCFDAEELLPLIRSAADSVLRYRLTMLLSKDGVWSAMPYLIRAMNDDPQNYNNYLYVIKKYTGFRAYVSNDLKMEITAALRESKHVPHTVNNQIFSDMRTKS